jgi:hypothetical protein
VLDAFGGPDQQMRIQKQFHASLSNNASISTAPIVLKSSGILACPAMKPNRLVEPSAGRRKQGFLLLFFKKEDLPSYFPFPCSLS